MKEFKTGDQVVMHSCHEADLPQYKGKIWTCRSDSYIAKCGDEVVFLDGFSGYFMADYLQSVNPLLNSPL